MSRLREELAGLLVDMQIADEWHTLYASIQQGRNSSEPRWQEYCERFAECATPQDLFVAVFEACEIAASWEKVAHNIYCNSEDLKNWKEDMGFLSVVNGIDLRVVLEFYAQFADCETPEQLWLRVLKLYGPKAEVTRNGH
jgi:hypothetical protein